MDQLILVLIVGAVALIKWFVENAGKSQAGREDAGDETPDFPANPSVPPRRVRPPGNLADPASRGESDEEKMRRFMEALGLPSNGVPPPRPAQPQRPAPRSVAPPLPRPIVRRTERPPMRPAVPAPQPQPRPELARRSIASPLDIGGPLPELPKSRPMSESAPASQVTSFRPSAPAPAPTQAGAAPASRQTASPFPSADMQAGLRDQLRDPASLRRAILLREILGEPKGLQSLESPSIFSPL
ncbi:MAG: hypothetical protein PHQ12_04810 [Chthoniobacteraceae bacterium]|nr:hypothetical protein [Chthoniobacteraceae bacterium]